MDDNLNPIEIQEFDPDLTPEEVLTRISVNLTTNNPDIDISNSVVLKDGKRAYKFAIIYKIKSRNTGEFKHNALHIKSFNKLKAGWIEKPEKSVILEDKDDDELKRLTDFLNAFIDQKIPRDNGGYLVVPEGEYEELSRLRDIDHELIQSIFEDADKYEALVRTGGVDLLNDIVTMSLNENASNEVVAKLKELQIDQLSKLNSIAGLSQLKGFDDLWVNNSENDSEEFWQKSLIEYAWVISQVFSYPVTLFDGKAYVGGKWIDNKGGNEVDFIYKNKLSSNVILIDIKTPTAKLIGSKYRQTYSPSNEYTGGISQLLNYKNKLSREYANLIANNPDKERFDVFNPKCLLIIGNFKEEIDSHAKKEAFELARSNSKDVMILTFDELHEKVKTMIQLLEN